MKRCISCKKRILFKREDLCLCKRCYITRMKNNKTPRNIIGVARTQEEVDQMKKYIKQKPEIKTENLQQKIKSDLLAYYSECKKAINDIGFVYDNIATRRVGFNYGINIFIKLNNPKLQFKSAFDKTIEFILKGVLRINGFSEEQYFLCADDNGEFWVTKQGRIETGSKQANDLYILLSDTSEY